MQAVFDDRSRQNPGKHGVGFRVTPPHPSRLLIDAIEPLKSQRLHTNRSALNLAGENVESPPDTHDERNIQLVTMRRQKSFLPRRRHPDEEAIRPAVTDIPDDLEFLVRREITVPQS